MQTANVMVNLGGDKGHQVPKLVTAAEIPVLIAIHGDEAISDVEPAEDSAIGNRDELERLYRIYGHATDGEGKVLVRQVYPGAGARVFQTLDELGLPDVFYKPIARAKPVLADPLADAESTAPDPLDHDGDGKKGGSKAKKKKADAPVEALAEAPVVDDTDTDGVKDMPDSGNDALFK